MKGGKERLADHINTACANIPKYQAEFSFSIYSESTITAGKTEARGKKQRNRRRKAQMIYISYGDFHCIFCCFFLSNLLIEIKLKMPILFLAISSL